MPGRNGERTRVHTVDASSFKLLCVPFLFGIRMSAGLAIFTRKVHGPVDWLAATALVPSFPRFDDMVNKLMPVGALNLGDEVSPEADKADAVVVGRTGKNMMERFLEGSTSRGLALHAKVPVTIVA